jgi:hypothetical protein
LALTASNGDLFEGVPDKGISLADLDAMSADLPSFDEMAGEAWLGQFDDDPSPYAGNYSEE